MIAASTCARAQEGDWQSKVAAPAGNPIDFEDARIRSEIHPVFMRHWLPDTFHFAGGTAPLGGDVRGCAVQLRYARTERLGLIATKDGYIEMRPDRPLTDQTGWANLAAGLKYALVDDAEKQLLITPGLTFELPTGNTDVLQGRGKGEWNPFVVANGYTILSEGENKLLGAVDLNTERYDRINFGRTKAGGKTQVTLGGGFRSFLTRNIECGIAYEAGVTNANGIFDSRLTVDLTSGAGKGDHDAERPFPFPLA